jgi:hypothetical protein
MVNIHALKLRGYKTKMTKRQQIQPQGIREIRLKIRETHSSPLDTAPRKADHLNPFQLLNEEGSDTGSGSENTEAKAIEAKSAEANTNTKPALHIDIEESSEVIVQRGPLVKSPPTFAPASTQTSAAQRWTPRKPPAPEAKQALFIPAVKAPHINSLQQKIIIYLDTLVQADSVVQVSPELKKEINDNFKVDVTKTFIAAAFNTKLQILFSQRNPERIENFFCSLMDSGLFQKLFPFLTNLKEARSDIFPICRMICKEDFEKPQGSLLKAFYDRLLMITCYKFDHSPIINNCLVLKEFYFIISSYAQRQASVDALDSWLQQSIFVPRFICSNFTKLLEEELLEKIFPGMGKAATDYYPKLLAFFKQIEVKSWSYDQYWSSNPNKRFKVSIDHLVYAHLIVCVLDPKSTNVKKSLIAIIEKNELFKRAFMHYQEPSPYFNLFQKAFENIHGPNQLNPFVVLNSSEKAIKFGYGSSLSSSIFGGTPKQGRLVTSNQDYRVTAHAAATLTP